jgi:hypothetical protein
LFLLLLLQKIDEEKVSLERARSELAAGAKVSLSSAIDAQQAWSLSI